MRTELLALARMGRVISTSSPRPLSPMRRVVRRRLAIPQPAVRAARRPLGMLFDVLAEVGRVERRQPGPLQQLVVAGALGQLEGTVERGSRSSKVWSTLSGG